MKILFLSRWFPYPIDNGAKLRIYHLLRGLAEAHEVHLVSFADDPPLARKEEIQAFCRSVRLAAWKEFQPGSRRALAGLFSPSPRSLVDIYSAEMEGLIRQALAEHSFDLVITSEWQMAAYRRLFSGLPVLFEEIEVGLPYGQYARASSVTARLRGGLTWLKHRHFLRELLADGKPCTVVSEEERRLLQAAVPGARNIHVIPNGVSIEEYNVPGILPQPGSLIFTGSFRYRPNHQAMVWFIERVLPRIQEQVPGVTLTITGDPAGLPLPERAGVIQTGFVDNVKPYIARAWASVVPLLIGGGTRLKILEAMSLKTPVIATSKGAEGLAAVPSEHLLIADSPEDFARQAVSLLRDASLRERLSASAYRLVAGTYDWKVIIPRLLEAVEQAASR
jgi:glycosyltransferase involved in cell wall biosynthesis